MTTTKTKATAQGASTSTRTQSTNRLTGMIVCGSAIDGGFVVGRASKFDSAKVKQTYEELNDLLAIAKELEPDYDHQLPKALMFSGKTEQATFNSKRAFLKSLDTRFASVKDEDVLEEAFVALQQAIKLSIAEDEEVKMEVEFALQVAGEHTENDESVIYNKTRVAVRPTSIYLKREGLTMFNTLCRSIFKDIKRVGKRNDADLDANATGFGD